MLPLLPPYSILNASTYLGKTARYDVKSSISAEIVAHLGLLHKSGAGGKACKQEHFAVADFAGFFWSD